MCLHEILDLLDHRIFADDSRFKYISHSRNHGVKISFLNIRDHTINIGMCSHILKIQIFISQFRRNIDRRFANQNITFRKLRKSGQFLTDSLSQCCSTHNTVRYICPDLHGTIHKLLLT